MKSRLIKTFLSENLIFQTSTGMNMCYLDVLV